MLLCLLSAIYFVRVVPETNGDGRLALVYAIVDQGTLAIDAYMSQGPTLHVDAAVHDSHYYTAKPPLPSLLLIPVYVLLRSVWPPGAIDDVFLRWLLTASLSGTAFIATLAIVWRIQRESVDQATPFFPGAVAVGLGTPLLVYASFLMSHELAALLLVLLLYFALRAPRASFGSGLLAGALISTEFQAAAGGAVLLSWVIYRRWLVMRSGGLLLPIAGLAIGVLPLLAYLQLAFGSPVANMYASLATPEFRAGYVAGALVVPPPDVIVALLFSPHRGLFVFAPLVLVGMFGMVVLWRRSPGARVAVALSAAAALAVFLATAAYVFWYGGASYGPRYLVPLLPLTCWPIAVVRARPLAVIAVLASLPQFVALTVLTPLLEPAHRFPYLDYMSRASSPSILSGPLGSTNLAASIPLVLAALAFIRAARSPVAVAVR